MQIMNIPPVGHGWLATGQYRADLRPHDAAEQGERLDNDPSGARYGCFLPDLTGLARRSPAPTSHGCI